MTGSGEEPRTTRLEPICGKNRQEKPCFALPGAGESRLSFSYRLLSDPFTLSSRIAAAYSRLNCKATSHEHRRAIDFQLMIGMLFSL